MIPFFVVALFSSVNCLKMDALDIFFVFLMVSCILGWVVTEFLFHKKNEPTWIKKARGNMSVTKYRRSLVGRKLEGAEALGCFRLGWTNEIEREQFNEVEQKQLQRSYSSEQWRNLSRLTWLIIIILFLCVRIFSGEMPPDYIIDTPPR